MSYDNSHITIQNSSFDKNSCLQDALNLLNSFPLEIIEKILLKRVPEVIFSCINQPPTSLGNHPETWFSWFFSLFTGASVTSMVFNPNPELHTFATGTSNGRIILYDTFTWQKTGYFDAENKFIESLAYSTDGSRLAVGEVSKKKIYSVSVYEISTKERISEFEVNQVPNSLVYNLDGSQIAVGSGGENYITIINLNSEPGERLRGVELQLGGDLLSNLAYSPILKNRLAVKTREGWLRIYNTETQEAIINLQIEDEPELWAPTLDNNLAYHPGGVYLAVGTSNRVLIINTENFRDIMTVETDYAVTALAYNLEGSRLAVGTRGGLRVYDSISLQDVYSFPSISVKSLSYSADSLAIKDYNQNVYIYHNAFPEFLGAELLLLWIAYCAYTYKGQKLDIKELSKYITDKSRSAKINFTLEDIYHGLNVAQRLTLERCFGIYSNAL